MARPAGDDGYKQERGDNEAFLPQQRSSTVSPPARCSRARAPGCWSRLRMGNGPLARIVSLEQQKHKDAENRREAGTTFISVREATLARRGEGYP